MNLAADRQSLERALALLALLSAVLLVAIVIGGGRFVVIGHGSAVEPWTAAPAKQQRDTACATARSANLTAALRQALARGPAGAAPEDAGGADAGAWLAVPPARAGASAPGCASTPN